MWNRGLGKARMHCKDGCWSTTSTKRATVVELKLWVGQTQSISFAPDAPLPFYDWNASLLDEKLGTKMTPICKRKERSERESVSAGAEIHDGKGMCSECDKVKSDEGRVRRKTERDQAGLVGMRVVAACSASGSKDPDKERCDYAQQDTGLQR